MVEEIDPVVVLQLKLAVAEMGVDVDVCGEDLVGRCEELAIDRVAQAIAKLLSVPGHHRNR